MNIRTYKEVLKNGIAEIQSFQNKDKLPINTGYDMFELLVPGSVVTIAGPSFTGKTIFLNDLKKNIMSVEYNALATNFVWLSNSLEMTTLMNTLRDLSFKLNKSKKEILTTFFNEYEKELVNNYFREQGDGRFFINEDPPTPDEFEAGVGSFLEKHKDKDLVVVDFDHTGLTKGRGKKEVMDAIYQIQNRFKKVYPNSLFIDVSQFNRESLGRTLEKDEVMKPRRSDLYQSDELFQVSDVVICLSIPYKLGIEQYRLVSPTFYDYLGAHFGDFNTKRTKVSFQTYGRIFFEKLKDRFTEGISSRDTFIKVIEEDNRPEGERSNAKEVVKKPRFKDEEVKVITVGFVDKNK